MDNLDPFFFGFGTYLPFSAQEFTPVVIDYRSAFKDGDGDDVYYPHKTNKPQYYLRISPPRTNRRGVHQYVTDSVIVPLGVDNTFRYKLAPSSLYHPYGRYIVEYFRRGNQIPIDTQEWLVPAVPKQALLSCKYETDENEIFLPLFVWQVRSSSPVVNFVAEYNRVIFNVTERPAYGSILTFYYEPAVTLDFLLEYSLSNINSMQRVRR